MKRARELLFGIIFFGSVWGGSEAAISPLMDGVSGPIPVVGRVGIRGAPHSSRTSKSPGK